MREILKKYKNIISRSEIIVWDSEPTSYRFKFLIVFVDGSELVTKDYLFSSGRKYSFHWQDGNGNLIIRWDNAEHWKSIGTFPHHLHKKGEVFSSREATLDDVLGHIYGVLKKGGFKK